jgi:hypothetical protein
MFKSKCFVGIDFAEKIKLNKTAAAAAGCCLLLVACFILLTNNLTYHCQTSDSYHTVPVQLSLNASSRRLSGAAAGAAVSSIFEKSVVRI